METANKQERRKRIAVITGASCGMGREFVRQIEKMESGLDEIWAVARNREALKRLQKEVPKVRSFALDITSRKDLEALEETLGQERPRIAWLVCSAGAGVQKTVEETGLSDLQNMIELNCTALTAVTKLCLPYCKKGHLLLLASGAAFMPQPGFAVYAASKAYVLSFARALHMELRGEAGVTAVCPGPVDTPFLDKMGGKEQMPGYKKPFIASPKKVVKKALKDAARGRELSVYGFSMKAAEIFCKIIPHRILLKCMYGNKRGAEKP